MKRFLPAVFFLSGFGWDSLTLKRIDNVLDTSILFVYLVLLGGLIVVSVFVEKGRLKHPFILKFKSYFPMGAQFFLGGLFSAYVVFYFKSASTFSSYLFLVILIGLLLGNEFIKHRLSQLFVLMVMYFLVLSSFFIFFVPIVLKHISYFSFSVAVLLSLMVVGGLFYWFVKQGVFQRKRELIQCVSAIGFLFVLLHVLYLKNWIPPVPLSLKVSGMYYQVQQVDATYHLTIKKPRWYEPWKASESSFVIQEGEAVYCFSSVFAPTRISDSITHDWQWFDPKKQSWMSQDKIGFDLKGGRDNGYRGYSQKQKLLEGQWRVLIKNKRGQVLGKEGFTVRIKKKSVTRVEKILIL